MLCVEEFIQLNLDNLGIQILLVILYTLILSLLFKIYKPDYKYCWLLQIRGILLAQMDLLYKDLMKLIKLEVEFELASMKMELEFQNYLT